MPTGNEIQSQSNNSEDESSWPNEYSDAEEAEIEDIGPTSSEITERKERRLKKMIFWGFGLLTIFILGLSVFNQIQKGNNLPPVTSTSNYGPAKTTPKAKHNTTITSTQPTHTTTNLTKTTSTNPGQDDSKIINQAQALIMAKYSKQDLPKSQELIAYLKEKLQVSVSPSSSPPKGMLSAQIVLEKTIILQYQGPESQFPLTRIINF